MSTKGDNYVHMTDKPPEFDTSFVVDAVGTAKDPPSSSKLYWKCFQDFFVQFGENIYVCMYHVCIFVSMYVCVHECVVAAVAVAVVVVAHFAVHHHKIYCDIYVGNVGAWKYLE